MTQELYKKHRPKKLQDIIGQAEAVKTLMDKLAKGKLPHAILLTGESGVGKSTIARILRNEVKCSNADFQQINCATTTEPIDTVRSIEQRMKLAPVGGPCRVWLLEEVQSFSRAKFAQQGLLEILEDTPNHCYFFLATTDPQKLIPAIHTRCTILKLKSLTKGELKKLVSRVCEAESIKLSEECTDRIAETAGGSARKALVILDQIYGLETEGERLEAIQKSDPQTQAKELTRALIYNRPWSEVCKILNEVDEDPETIRHSVLGYATAVILKGGKFAQRAYAIIGCFESNFYDSKKAGLVRACYDVSSK